MQPPGAQSGGNSEARTRTPPEVLIALSVMYALWPPLASIVTLFTFHVALLVPIGLGWLATRLLRHRTSLSVVLFLAPSMAATVWVGVAMHSDPKFGHLSVLVAATHFFALVATVLYLRLLARLREQSIGQ